MHGIFLAYANAPLRTSPESLRSVFAEIKNSFGVVDPKHMDALAKRMIRLIEYNDPACVPIIRKEICDRLYDNKNKWMVEEYFEIAQTAVYGFVDGFCENQCYDGPHRRDRFGERLEGLDRLKCHECDQLAFQFVLDDIISGKEWSQIFDISLLLFYAESLTRTYKIIQSKNNDGFKEKWEAAWIWKGVHPIIGDSRRYGDPQYRFHGRLGRFLYSIVGHSFFTFFANNDRRRLKRCPVCNKFFIAKDLKRMKCYDKRCNKEYERLKKQKQREEKPEIYTS